MISFILSNSNSLLANLVSSELIPHLSRFLNNVSIESELNPKNNEKVLEWVETMWFLTNIVNC